MAKIHIKRKHENLNTNRAYNIYIDNKKVGTIDSGENKSFEVEEGKYVIEAKMDWRGSQKFALEINIGETKNLYVSGFNRIEFITTFVIPSLLISFPLIYFFNLETKFLMLIYVVLYLIYSVTIGRGKHLTLTLEE